MSLKKLNSMQLFNNAEFFEKKTYMLFGVEDLTDYDSKKVIGCKYKVVIFQDNTNYGGDVGISNAGESLTVKVPGVKASDYDGQPRQVRLINPRGTIYGDYRNELSVKADGLEFVNEEE